MNFVQLSQLLANQSKYSLPFPLIDLEKVENHILINKKIVYPVENISKEYNPNTNIIIQNNVGVDIGVLLFLLNKDVEIGILNEYELVSLLIDCDDEALLSNKSFSFKSNYVVIDEQYFLDYEFSLKNSSPIWGKYNHNYTGIAISIPTPKIVTNVVAQELTGFNHPFYYESAIRGLQQGSPFERYLKYYHLLELNFDYDVIRRVQSLDINTDSHEMGKLLREYESKEFLRLEYLFDAYCIDINPIVDKLNVVAAFPAVADDMFFVFGKKEAHPFPEGNAKYLAFIGTPGLFSLTNYKTIINKSGTSDTYRKFIGRLVMYMIYRMRNSIAHNKIGEYLLTSSNQEFISDFGEPLLLEVIKQVFKN